MPGFGYEEYVVILNCCFEYKNDILCNKCFKYT